MAFPDKYIKFPFGDADVQPLEDGATLALTVNNTKTIASVSLSQAATLNVTPNAELPVGSELHLKVTSDATGRDVTLGTNITGPTLAGTANKTKVATFVYDGSAFLQTGAVVQLD
jgi:hypothetical protein